MAKPIINSIRAFDSALGTVVLFNVPGAQTYGNKIWVYDAATLALLYEYPSELTKGPSPVQASCVIPSNTLVNGGRYFCQIQCVLSDGSETSISEKSAFYCLSRPELHFAGVTNGMKIDASHLDVILAYAQSDGEKLQTYRFTLYDRNKVPIRDSETFFVAQRPDMTYRFKGMSTGQTYYISAIGITSKGMIAETGMFEINPEYVLKKDYAQLELANRAWGGYVEVSTNIRLVGFRLRSEEYAFIQGEYLNLNTKDPTKKTILLYDDGFLIEGGFTAFLDFYGARINEPIMTISNSYEQKIVVSAHRVDNLAYFKLSVKDGETQYVRYTQRVAYSKTKIYKLFMRKYEDDLWMFNVYDGSESGVITDDYSFTQQDGYLYLTGNGYIPTYYYSDPSLYTDEDRAYYDTSTGNLYLVV